MRFPCNQLHTCMSVLQMHSVYVSNTLCVFRVCVCVCVCVDEIADLWNSVSLGGKPVCVQLISGFSEKHTECKRQICCEGMPEIQAFHGRGPSQNGSIFASFSTSHQMKYHLSNIVRVRAVRH